MTDVLTDFLVKLATDDDYVERYRANREAVLDEAGLSGDTKAVLQSREATLDTNPLPSTMQATFDPSDPRNR